MEPIHLVHLILIASWGGVVLAESFLELAGSDDASLRQAARVHYLIDVWAELPLLVGIVATGTVLTLRTVVLTQLHLIKIGAGGIAIAVNLYCVVLVVLRHRHLDDSDALRRYSRQVRLVGVAVPFGVLAAYLGLAYFRA